jgi:hypothetical protein
MVLVMAASLLLRVRIARRGKVEGGMFLPPSLSVSERNRVAQMKAAYVCHAVSIKRSINFYSGEPEP